MRGRQVEARGSCWLPPGGGQLRVGDGERDDLEPGVDQVVACVVRGAGSEPDDALDHFRPVDRGYRGAGQPAVGSAPGSSKRNARRADASRTARTRSVGIFAPRLLAALGDELVDHAAGRGEVAEHSLEAFDLGAIWRQDEATSVEYFVTSPSAGVRLGLHRAAPRARAAAEGHAAHRPVPRRARLAVRQAGRHRRDGTRAVRAAAHVRGSARLQDACAGEGGAVAFVHGAGDRAGGRAGRRLSAARLSCCVRRRPGPRGRAASPRSGCARRACGRATRRAS